MPSPSGSSSSTARSAPTSRASTSAADDFGGADARGLQRDALPHPPRRHRAACTRRSSTSASTPSRRPASAASRPCSPSTTSPTRRTSSTSPPPASPARSPTATPPTAAPRYVAGSIGPGTKLPSLGHIGFADLRDAYEEQAAGLLEGGVDLFLIETCMRPAAGQGGDDRLPAGDARPPGAGAAAGAGDDGDDRADARRQRDRRRPRVARRRCGPTCSASTAPPARPRCRSTCATCRQHSPLPISVLPNAGLPSVVDGRTHYDLTPEQLAEFHRRHVAELGVDVVGGCCGTTPEHLRQVVEAVRDLEPARRTPEFEPSVSSIYSPVTIEQDLSFLIIGERTNANGSKAFRDAMLAGDWDTLREDGQRADPRGRPRARRLRRLRRPRRRRRHGRDRQALRHPGQRAARARLHRAAGAGGRRCSTSAAGRSSTRPTSRTASCPGSRIDRVFSLARDYGAAVICLLIDERGQARDVEWKMEIAHRIHEIATERYGLSAERPDLRRADVPAVDRRRRPAPRRHRHDRGDPADQGRDPRRPHDARRVQRQLRPQRRPARHALNSVFLHECVQAGLDSAIVHAGKIVPLNRLPDEQREVCLDLVWDRRGRRLRPAAAAARGVRRRQVDEDREARPQRAAGRASACSQRIIDGDRDGLTADLDEAMAGGHRRRSTSSTTCCSTG